VVEEDLDQVVLDKAGGAGGSGIVIVKQTSSNIASGVWSLQCQYNFKKQGTWTPSAPFDVDYLVVAGGGGGGGNLLEEVEQEDIELHFQEEQKLSLTGGTSFPITVGAGGSGPPKLHWFRNSGTDSIFSTITSAGGGGGGSGTPGTGG
jgi:hypothetical protein